MFGGWKTNEALEQHIGTKPTWEAYRDRVLEREHAFDLLDLLMWIQSIAFQKYRDTGMVQPLPKNLNRNCIVQWLKELN